jgi:kynureninase
MAALRASMEIFDEAGMDRLTRKSKKLTGFLDFLMGEVNREVKGINTISVLTPSESRGCQLSLVIGHNGKAIHEYLLGKGVIADWRHPDVIRVAPVPLYNTFQDVFKFGALMLEAIYKYKNN